MEAVPCSLWVLLARSSSGEEGNVFVQVVRRDKIVNVLKRLHEKSRDVSRLTVPM